MLVAPLTADLPAPLPPNTAVSAPLTPVLVAPLTAMLDEEEARQAEPDKVEPPPVPHIPLETPPVVVGKEDLKREPPDETPTLPAAVSAPHADPSAEPGDAAPTPGDPTQVRAIATQIVAAGLATAREAAQLALLSEYGGL